MSIEPRNISDNPAIAQWQMDLIDLRLAEYNNNPSALLDWDTILKEFNYEDEKTQGVVHKLRL